MSAPYDLSFMNSTNPPVDAVTSINNVTNGVVGAGICLIIYFVIIKGATDNGYSIGKSLLTASTILSVISGILLGLQWLPSYVLGINIAVLIASIFIVIFGDK